MRLTALTTLFLALAISVNGYCETNSINRWGFGTRIFYYDIAPGTLKDAETEFEQSAAGELHAIYHATSWFSLEVSAQYAKTDMEAYYDDKRGDMGTLEQIPLLIIGNIRFPVEKVNAYIYLGAGIGYFINSFENETHDHTREFFAENQTIDVKDSLGGVLSFGSEYQFTPEISLLFDIKCVFQKADVEVQSEKLEMKDTNTSLNTSLFGLGLRYYF